MSLYYCVLLIFNFINVNCNVLNRNDSNLVKQNYQIHNINSIALQLSKYNKINNIDIREKKFLNLFNVIKFENVECNVPQTKETSSVNGTCYHDLECESFGGIAMGTCANGLGVCCVFIYNCGAETNQSNSYFENPHYPMSTFDPITCTFSITLGQNIQQILLEFLTFELQRPVDGNCVQDQFIVSGQSRNFLVPVICGINTNQHMYIDVTDASENKVILSIFSKDYAARAFRIRVSQLETNLAPAGCLQYYYGEKGIMKSFNFEDTGMYINPGTGSYFNNLNYAICVERSANMCKISYANENNEEEFPFEIVNDNEGTLFFESCHSVPELGSCENDFILINSVRLCGGNLQTTRKFSEAQSVITDLNSGPIVLHFITNNEDVGKGFKLLYFQESCL